MKQRYWVCLLALGVLHSVGASTFDWQAFEQAIVAYHATPSAVTADAIRAALPSEHVSYDHSPAEQSALRALDQLLPTLFVSIRNRDRIATALGFDFLLVTDGGALEHIFGALSELITLDPALFLEGLKTRSYVPHSLITFMGQRFVDRDPAVRCNELQDRQRAIAGITDAGLADVREPCLATLAQAIAGRCPTPR